MSAVTKVILHGLTQDGRKFRPSDWAERLCGAVATYDKNRRITFHPSVALASIDGIKCVVIDASLEKDDEMLFSFLNDFAIENNLQIKHSPPLEDE